MLFNTKIWLLSLVFCVKGPLDDFPTAVPLDVALHLPILEAGRPSRGCWSVAQVTNFHGKKIIQTIKLDTDGNPDSKFSVSKSDRLYKHTKNNFLPHSKKRSLTSSVMISVKRT